LFGGESEEDKVMKKLDEITDQIDNVSSQLEATYDSLTDKIKAEACITRIDGALKTIKTGHYKLKLLEDYKAANPKKTSILDEKGIANTCVHNTCLEATMQLLDTFNGDLHSDNCDGLEQAWLGGTRYNDFRGSPASIQEYGRFYLLQAMKGFQLTAVANQLNYKYDHYLMT
jgi:hypothetical protein